MSRFNMVGSSNYLDLCHRLLLTFLFQRVAAAVGSSGGGGGSSSIASSASCEPIKISMCTSLGYNMTRMPNLAQKVLQSDAGAELDTFAPLIQSACSTELQFFLCSVYAPMCVTEFGSPQSVIGPCQPLCQRVRNKCVAVLQKFGYSWPLVLNCSKFAESNNDDHMCMEGPGEGGGGGGADGAGRGGGAQTSLLNALQTNHLFLQKVKEKLSSVDSNVPSTYKDYVDLLESNGPKETATTITKASSPDDCSYLKNPSEFVFVPRYNKCVRRCLLRNDDKGDDSGVHESMDIVLAVCTALSASLIAASLFLAAFSSLNTTFLYPDRSLLFLTISHLGLISGYAIRAFKGRQDIYCEESGGGEPFLTQEGHRNSVCFLGFVFLYFFSSAASAWFTAVSFCYMASSTALCLQRRLCLETVVYHLFGWGVPAFLTVLAIVTNSSEADEFTGLCFVGSQDDALLLKFVILPLACQAALAVVFLGVAGVVSAAAAVTTTTTTAQKQQQQQTDCSKSGGGDGCISSNNGRIKLGFCALYMTLQVAILATYCFEYERRSSEWLQKSPETLHLAWYLRFVALHLSGIASAVTVIYLSNPQQVWTRHFVSLVHPARAPQTHPNVNYQKQELQQDSEQRQGLVHAPRPGGQNDQVFL